MADDEDIEEVNSTLKFKDRKYNSKLASGKGYKILRKNWTKVGGKMINFLTQDMINETNTIYEIRYDFDLNEKDIIIPEGCILKFNGGVLTNGNIIYNNCKIIDNININTYGTFDNKPTNKDGIDIGFSYFCPDRQTSEGVTNGIIIYHKGDNVWADALGRVVS